jgi:hypothetical protein
VVLEALVAENMAPPEQQLSVLQAKLNALDNQFRNAMSAEKSLQGAHFPCFTGAKVRILTLISRRGAARRDPRAPQVLYSIYLLYWYESTNTDANFATRVRLSRMERELRESNTNLTSYVSGLQTELDGWKAEGTRALSKLEEKQGADKEAFLQVYSSVYYSVYYSVCML